MENFSYYIKSIIYSLPSITGQLLYPTCFKNRKKIWKGIMVSNALKIKKVEEFVKNTLRNDLQKDQNITLKNFYYESSKKYKLTFTAVDAETKIIEFLNYVTVPNMPLVEAIKASMTLPFFMEPLKMKGVWWEHSSIPNDLRAIKETFYPL